MFELMSAFHAKAFVSKGRGDIEDIEDNTEVISLQHDSDHLKTEHEPSPNPSSSSRSSRKGSRKMKPLMVENGSDSPSDLLLSGIFCVDDSTYDVNLYNSYLVLTIIGGKIKSKEGRRMSVKRVQGDTIEVSIKDLFGVTIRRQKPRAPKKTGVCQGVELHTYSERDANRLKHKIIFLVHPSEDICTQWHTAIRRRLLTINGRPRHARFYMDIPSADESEFLSKVSPILDGAGLEHYLLKGHDFEKITKDIEKTDLTQFDCILVAGGDPLVHTVVNAVAKKAQFENGIVLGGKETMQQCILPIGVIPCGISNVIAHTVHGTSDMVTAALDIVYGRTLLSDVLSVSHSQGSYFQFAFSAQYGYGSTVMKAVNKAKLNTNRYQLAIAKGLTKAKLRGYDCEARYKSVSSSCGNPKDGKTCRSGCTVCNNDSSTPCPDGTSYTTEMLQEFDPLDISNTSSQLTELALSDSRDGLVKGEHLSVSVYATFSPCEMAPLGLSKNTHIADGCMDLVMVKQTERKEFMRFLKRHGNSKSQCDFPFVESHRVREIKFHVRMPVSWNYRDKDYSEINDQSRHQKSRLMSAANEEPIKVIADGDKSVISDLRIDDSSDEEDDDLSASNSRASSSKSKSGGVPSLSGDQTEDNKAGHVHIIHQYTETDRRLKRQSQKRIDKEMKEKAKEEKLIRSTWYLDSVPCPELDLTFRVHQKLVTFYGSGMSPNTEEVDVFCFPAV